MRLPRQLRLSTESDEADEGVARGGEVKIIDAKNFSGDGDHGGDRDAEAGRAARVALASQRGRVAVLHQGKARMTRLRWRDRGRGRWISRRETLDTSSSPFRITSRTPARGCGIPRDVQGDALRGYLARRVAGAYAAEAGGWARAVRDRYVEGDRKKGSGDPTDVERTGCFLGARVLATHPPSFAGRVGHLFREQVANSRSLRRYAPLNDEEIS